MSFLTPVFSWLGPAIAALTTVVSTVSSGVKTALDVSGIATLFNVITGIVTPITSLVENVSGALLNIVDPILGVVNSVQMLSASIENNIIGPLVRPIVDTVRGINSLADNIERLVDQGIGGIIEIPKALANSLTAIEANWSRATQDLARANAQIVRDLLNPGLVAAVAPGLKAISEEFLTYNRSNNLDPSQVARIPLGENAAELFSRQGLAEVERVLANPEGLPEKLLWAFVTSLRYVIASTTSMASALESGIDDAREANPTKTFSPSDAVSFYQRGILSWQDALHEIRRAGYSERRALVMREAAEHLPSPGDAIDWWFKGLIVASKRDEILIRHGWTRDAIDAGIAASKVSIPENTLLDWLAKGLIDQSTFNSRMAGKGYSPADISDVLADALSEPQVNTTINWFWNSAAAKAGWYPETYGSRPPADVVEAGRKTRVDPIEVERRWQGQFASMALNTAITLFFRGELSRREVEIVAVQNGYPQAMTDRLILAASPLLPARSVPSLVAKGEISEVEGRTRLQARGYTLEDATLLIDAAVKDVVGDGTAEQTEATKITIAQVRGAYRDGIVDEQGVRDFLNLQGLSAGDIEFIVALDNYDISAAARKDEIDTIKAEVGLGVLQPDDAVERLYALGLTEPEVIRVVSTLNQTKRANAKIPDLGLLRRMIAKGLINQEEFTDSLLAIGYGENWAAVITALEFSPGEPSDGSEAP